MSLYQLSTQSKMERDNFLMVVKLQLQEKQIGINDNDGLLLNILFLFESEGFISEKLKAMVMSLVKEDYQPFLEFLERSKTFIKDGVKKVKKEDADQKPDIFRLDNRENKAPQQAKTLVKFEQDGSQEIFLVRYNNSISPNMMRKKESLKKKEHIEIADSSESQQLQAEQSMFSYSEEEKVSKEIILIIITNKTVVSVVMLGENTQLRIPLKESIQKGQIIITKIPLLLNNLKRDAGEYTIKIELKKFFQNQLLQFPIISKLKWYKKKGIVIAKYLDNHKQSSELQKESILRSTLLFKNEEDWSVLQPWWYLLKKQYERLNSQEKKYNFKQAMIHIMQGSSHIFSKHFIWLLWGIFKRDLWELIKVQKLIQSKLGKIVQNYTFQPIMGNKALQKLQLVYLRTLYYLSNKKELLQLNFAHQKQQIQKQMILQASSKELQSYQFLFEQKLVENDKISCSEFIGKYFPFIIQRIVQTSNKLTLDSRKKYQNQQVIEAAKCLYKKCQKLSKKHERKDSLLSVSYLIHDLLINEKTKNAINQQRLDEGGKVEYISIAKQIYKFQLNLTKQLLKPLAINNQFKIKKALKERFSDYFFLFLTEPRQTEQVRVTIIFITQNPNKLVELYKSTSQDKKYTIIQFVRKQLADMKFEQKYLQPHVDLQEYQKLTKELPVKQPEVVQIIHLQDNVSKNSKIILDSPNKKFHIVPSDSLEIFLVIISEHQYNKVFLKRLKRDIGGFKNIKINNYRYVSFTHLKNIEEQDLINKQLEIRGEEGKTKPFPSSINSNKLRFIWMQDDEISPQETAITFIHTLQCFSLSKNMESSLFQWNIRFTETIEKIHYEVFTKAFTRQIKNITLSCKFLIGLFILIDKHYEDREIEFLQNKEFWMQAKYATIKFEVQLFQKEDSSTMKSKVLKLFFIKMFLLFIGGANTITISKIQQILQFTYVNQGNEKQQKQIIIYLLKQGDFQTMITNTLIDLDDSLTKWILSNRLISNKQFFKIKLFYMVSLIQRKRQHQQEIVLQFINKLMQKCQSNSSNKDTIAIQIKQSTIKSIFFRESLNHMIKSYQGKKAENQSDFKFIFTQSKQFIRFYYIFKSIKDKQISQILYSFLKETFDKLLLDNLKQNFKETIKAIMVSSFRDYQRVAINNLIENNQVSQFHILHILDAFFLHKSQQVEQVRTIIRKIQGKDGDVYLYKDNFLGTIQQIYKKHQNNSKRLLIKLVEEMIERLKIQQKDFGLYFKALKYVAIAQIKQYLVDKICSSFFNIYRQNGKRHQILFDCLGEQQGGQIVEKYYKKYDKQQACQEQKRTELWKAMINTPHHIYYLSLRFKSAFKPALQYCLKMLQNGSYKKIEIDALSYNKATIIIKIRTALKQQAEYGQKLKKLIEQGYKKSQQTVIQLKNLQTIFTSINMLTGENQKIGKIITNMQQGENISSLVKLAREYSQVASISDQINIYKNFPCWQQQNIYSIESLQEEYYKCKITVLDIAKNISNNKVSYQQFQSYFLRPKITEIRIIFKSNPEECKKVVEIAELLTDSHFSLVSDTLNGLIHLRRVVKEKINPVQMELFQKFQAICLLKQNREQLQLGEIQLLTHQVIALLDQELKFKWKFQEKGQIIRTIYNNRELFEKIDKTEIDHQKLNNLKAFSNEIQNTIVKLDTVRDFKMVFELWQTIKTSKRFDEVSKKLGTFERQKNMSLVNLNKCIQNLSNEIDRLFQKLEQANNLESFFKNSIKKILGCSIMKIQQTTSMRIVILTGRNDQVIDYKKLTNLKQKSLLQLYSEIDDQQNKEEIQMLRIYCDMFKEIEAIDSIIKQLTSYGYDSKKLVQDIPIQQNNYSQVKLKRLEMEVMKESWIKNIRNIYSRSYLLTHFVGIKLVQFTNAIVNGIFYESLQHILQIDHQQYQRIVQENAYHLSEMDTIGKIEVIAQMFDKDQPMEMEEQKVNKIKMITSSVSNFSYYVYKQNNDSLPRTNEVFYCHSHTLSQELEFFLYRAIINYNRHHFIIGVHRLSESTKNSFCVILKEIKKNKSKQLTKSLLVFIDNSQLSIVYSYLLKPKNFNIQKKMNFVVSQESLEKTNAKIVEEIRQIYLITSQRAGLGKTYHVQMQAIKRGKNLYHFPICGNIDLKKVGKRLKQLNFKGQQILLIKIGHTIDKQLLNIFLQSLVLYRCFFADQYIYLDRKTIIYIEYENIYVDEGIKGQYIDEKYTILRFLQGRGREIRINGFNPRLINFQNAPLEDLFVYCILQLLDSKLITNDNITFSQFKKENAPNHQKKIQLLQKYYLRKMKHKQTSYLLYRNLMKMLFILFETFSNDQKLHPQLFNQITIFQRNRISQLSDYREKFLQILIDNGLTILQETLTQNLFQQRSNSGRNFRQVKDDISLLILPIYERDAYRFLYFNCNKVPPILKQFNTFQDIKLNKLLTNINPTTQQVHQVFSRYSLQNLADEQLQHQMLSILKAVSSDSRSKVVLEDKKKMLENYKLTKDNFLKMCCLIQRERCGIPCVIQGESGVGKTALINFLSSKVFQYKLVTKNIHAGIHEDDLTKIIDEIKKEAQKLQTLNWQNTSIYEGNKKLWVFFDEFNTSQEVSYIKQIVIQHRFMGKRLPQNIHFFAACNPYRKLQIEEKVDAGLKKKRANNSTPYAFKVLPPPLSMVQLMWDYQQLTKEQNKSYFQKMLKDIKHQKQAMIYTMVQIHEKIKRQIEVSAVSLRDVERVKKLYRWFQVYFGNLQKLKNKTYKYNDLQQRVLCLSLIFCYCIRFSKQKVRQDYMELIEKSMKWSNKYCQNVLLQAQTTFSEQILQQKEQKERIAANQAFRENIFTTFVCIMNKIPVLLIGNPGSSKSLSVHILASNLNGTTSTNQLFKAYPEINMIYFQGSQSSTSAGVQQVFNKAQISKSQKYNYLNCIYFDEIGLAEISVHNPLKVLHSRLQLHNDLNFSFIGISNYELDASKMSRFLVLNRSSPPLKDLQQTVHHICKSIQPVLKTRNTKIPEEINNLGAYYYHFIEQWNQNNPQNSGFFGMRDFYHYVKYVSTKILQQQSFNNLKNIIYESMQVNFDGQENSCLQFLQILPKQFDGITFQKIHPIRMINNNIQNNSSRCLLQIVSGDTLIPYVQRKIDRKSIVYYGSAFEQDEKSQEYNYEIISKVMSHMSRGQIIFFKDPNNSIQSSLYDLFNKSYIVQNDKMYCRIAVGANSNPKCLVHQNFSAIIFIQENKVSRLDLPFLNRFQKHYLKVQNLILKKDEAIKDHIIQWIQSIIPLQADSILTRQNFIVNSSEQSINNLILKYQDKPQQQKIQNIKIDLLKNRTIDFEILCKSPNYNEKIIYELQDLYEKTQTYDKIEDKDVIIYTYDQYIHLEESENNMIQGCYKLKISEMQSQKQLKNELKKGLRIDGKLLILINYERDYKFIQQVLYLAKQIKDQQRSQKQIFIIVQLHRFSFVKSQQKHIKNINISYLHEYEQFFHQNFEVEHLQASMMASNYYPLLQLLNNHEARFLQGLNFEAVSLLKLKFQNNQQNEKIYFEQLGLLNQESFYLDMLKQFITEILSSQKMSINYFAFHNNKEQIYLCSNIYQAAKNILSSIVKKIIVIFLKLILQNRFTILFSKNLSQKFLKSTRKDIQFLKQYESRLNDEVQKLKQSIVAEGIDYLRIIKEENEANEVLVKEYQGYFSFVEIIKKIQLQYNCRKQAQFFSVQMQEIDNHFQAFSIAYYTQIQNEPLLKSISNSRQLEFQFIKDAVKYITNSKLQDKCFDFIAGIIHYNVVTQTIEHKNYFILCGNKPFMNYLFSILSIVIEYHQDLQALKANFSQIKLTTSSIIENSSKFGKYIMNVVLNICRLSNKTLDYFQSINHYCICFKRISQKINQINCFQQFQLQVQEDFYIIHKLIQLHQRQNQALPRIFFESPHSLYETTYNYIEQRIKTGSKQANEKYSKFLSYSFFEHWIAHILKYKIQLQQENCLDKFISLCNTSSDFAIRSASFFNIIFERERIEKIVVLQRVITKNRMNSFINKHLKPQSLFIISLTNYFYRLVEELIQVQSQNNPFVLTSFYNKFQTYVQKTDRVQQVMDIYKVAFIKRYLSIYISSLIERKQDQTLRKIDQLYYERNALNREMLYYMVKMLKNTFSEKQIQQNFIKLHKCQWVNHEGVKQYIQKGGQIKNEKQIKYMFLFYNVKSVMIPNHTYEQSAYKHLQSNSTFLLKDKYEIINFFIRNNPKDKIKYGYFLINFQPIISFLNKIKNLCHLNIKRFEKYSLTIGQFINKYCKNDSQKNLIKGQLSRLSNYCKNIINQMQPSKMSQFNKNKAQFRFDESTTLHRFVWQKNNNLNKQNQNLGLFVEYLVKNYNQICFSLNQISKKSNRKVKIIKEDTKYDPLSLSKQTKILQLLDYQQLQGLVSKYSHYSFGEVSSIQFSLPQIQQFLLKKAQNLHLFLEDKQSFSQPEYIGDNSHFLVQMKKNPTNKTLQYIHKKVDVDSYFRELKIKSRQTFHAKIKKIQKNLQPLMVYYKNIHYDPTMTLAQLIKAHVSNIKSQLLEEPFASMPCSVLVDLYEFVEFLTFQHIKNMLHQNYCEEDWTPEQKQGFKKLLLNLQLHQNKEYPSMEQFKKALYRFACRKVMSQNIDPKQLLSIHLCKDQVYWDQYISKKAWMEIESNQFQSYLHIRISNLKSILDEVPFSQGQVLGKVQEIPEERYIRKSNKKMY